MAHEHYRQTTDGWAIAYSERERKFTFTKNGGRKLMENRLAQVHPEDGR